jgi:basic membrane lipoprotein Med (substrate-binding protein (PBP1-ABC) superfamily)
MIGARYVIGERLGLSACHAGGLARGFSDPEWGKDTANQEIDQGADIIFATHGCRRT